MTRDQKLEREALIIQAADYCILYGWSVREIADNMLISKTTIHRWLTEDLQYIDDERYQSCKRNLRDKGGCRW